jgi:L-asparaginase
MKKILVIGTGGTIAAVRTPGGLRPAYTTEELISFFPEVRGIANVEGKLLLNIDSTNMQPHHWSEIAEEIARQYDKYDGFVITHGTDTMQYTAAALSLMLQGIAKPVVLTGSVKPMGEGSDAKQNFVDSVIVACSGVREVCVVFHGKIIRGCRARKITNEATKITNETLDVYSSINFHLIGDMIGELRENSMRKAVLRKTETHAHDRLKVLPNIDAGVVALVKIYPGFRPEALGGMTGVKCVLLEAYGPGNVPFMENSLLDAIGRLCKRGIPVFITTQNPFGEVDMSLYEVGRRALAAGAVPCYDMTSEAALVKLMWIAGNFGSDAKTLKERMLKNFVGEIHATGHTPSGAA